ncbi:hypothetical protein V2J09_006711 [Rumex salicifolius]
MAEEGTDASTKQAVCQECKVNPSKYKCPGCSFRSCSLACVKSHKKRTSCTGKRDQTHFVPLSQFDDSLLLSDFNLLEDVKRVAESARRTRFKLGAYPKFSLPGHLKGLQNAAARRRTELWFLPGGMLRRKRNESRYNRRNKSILWTIEWRFHSTDAVLLEHGIKENIILRSVIQKHLQPSPWNHKLRKFCDEHLENLKFFISKCPKGPRSAFRELDINAPLSHLLSNLMILEYPVIHVFLPSDSYDFKVVRDLKPIPVKLEPKPCETDNLPNQSDGTLFREEEFEEGIFPEPQILDLVSDFKACSHEQKPAKNESAHGNESQAFELPEEQFEFDQDLIDPLPKFLLEDYNPDDYFDFEMGFGEDVAVASDELEEGEIPGSE